LGYEIREVNVREEAIALLSIGMIVMLVVVWCVKAGWVKGVAEAPSPNYPFRLSVAVVVFLGVLAILRRIL